MLDLLILYKSLYSHGIFISFASSFLTLASAAVIHSRRIVAAAAVAALVGPTIRVVHQVVHRAVHQVVTRATE